MGMLTKLWVKLEGKVRSRLVCISTQLNGSLAAMVIIVMHRGNAQKQPIVSKSQPKPWLAVKLFNMCAEASRDLLSYR